MISLLLGLSAVNLLCLSLAVVSGYTSAPGHWHLLSGASATLVCCGVHCIVFTYFIATGKWVQHAVTLKRLDESLAHPTRSFKAQAFPAALLAMASVFFAAVFGAITDNYAINPIWHHVSAWAAVLINALVAVVEFHAVRRNGMLIDRILEAAGAAGAQSHT